MLADPTMNKVMPTSTSMISPLSSSQAPARSTVAIAAVSRGDADVTREFTEVGLSRRAAWYSSIALYGGAGSLVTALGVAGVVPRGVLALGVVAMLVGVLCVFGMKRLEDTTWALHLRLLTGSAIFLGGYFVMGPQSSGFVMFPLISLLAPTYLLGLRFAVPYMLLASGITVAFALNSGPPVAHAVIATGALMSVGGSFMIAKRNAHELARINRRLAYCDPLTGVGNVRSLRERLETELERIKVSGEPFALFALDLDNFKLVNDTFDHSTGDRVLRAVADAISAAVGEHCLVARRGGDEFSVLVPSKSEDLSEMCLRLRNSIQIARTATCPEVTPSGSVAWVEASPSDTVSTILSRADDALHDAKQEFRAEHGIADRSTISHGGDSFDIEADDTSPRASRRDRDPGYARVRGHWIYASMNFIFFGLLIGAVSVLGAMPSVGRSTGLTFAAAFAGLFVVGAIAGARRARLHLLHLQWLTGAALVTVLALIARDAGVAVIDLFVPLTITAFFYFRPRVAFVHFGVNMGAFAALAFAGGYPYAELLVSVTTGVTLLAIGIVTKLRSVTMRFSDENRLLSQTDSLSGLANMRALDARLSAILGERDLAYRPALVALDLDKFKSVNDNYSHTVGDAVIESVSRAIAGAAQDGEFLARRGGDEFLVLCDYSDADRLGALAGRLEREIQRVRADLCPDIVSTVSIGIAVWQPGDTATQFRRRADLALHESKAERYRSGPLTATG